ncbi:galactose mutarotase-like [Stegodyphus dumicola]|uniref:galactose mutarotase-like n=1 Tax=Stegodyphus dumicola TaxID=202533 RepID=UPI0015B26274|nr:galactose mutarotase-like [Stegodyphus dumicola]
MVIAIREDSFGHINNTDGDVRDVRRFTLTNNKIEFQVISYGATITSLKVPDKDGNLEDIVLGFDDISSYVNHPHYFGCTVGRFANRIAKGKFVLQNKEYNLTINNAPNHLHGGIKGFDKVIWDSIVKDNLVQFSYTSPSMEENYPGELKCTVSFELTDANEILINYEAVTTHITPINLTNHSYFNLGGHGSGTIHDHVIEVNADYYTPVDETSIPTGDIVSVASTAFDLRKPRRIGSILNLLENGLDHNFCINGNVNSMRKVASISHVTSGRLMEVFSTQPGVQIYTANYLPEDASLIGKHKKCYKKHGAVCLETQNFPDAINHVNFPKAILDVGEVYKHVTKFVFTLC